MGDCSTNCNPCGPSYDGINQLATQSAAYARQAKTSATNAENSWLEFNALYLGAFASAPTVDNEGNPLQEGALYFNSVSNEMFVWQGGSWITFGFDEFTPFLATGSTTARNLVTREADVVNVKDFGAVGDGVVDDTAAFQAAYNAVQSNGTIIVPSGTYNIPSPVIGTTKRVTWKVYGIAAGTTPYFSSQKIPYRIQQTVENHQIDYNDGSIVDDPLVGPTYLYPNTHIGAFSDYGGVGILGQCSNLGFPANLTIGVSGAVINAVPDKQVWAGYFDVQCNSTATGIEFTHGIEIAAKNKGLNKNDTPYLKTGGVLGIWLAGGGDPLGGGGAPTNPSNTGISFIKNGHTWNKGIVFHETALTGCDGVTGIGSAISMAKGHQVEWWASGSTAPVAYIRSDVTEDVAFQRILIENGGTHIGTESVDFVNIAKVNNAANGLVIYPNTSGQPVILAPIETNGTIKIQATGTGEIYAGSNFVAGTDNSTSIGRSGQRFTTIWAVNGTIQTSDEREKTEIKNSELGLDFITSLRPVSYKFKVGENVIVEKDEIGNPTKIEQRAGERQHFGLIAQEVKSAIPNGVDFGGWILTDKNNPDSEQGLRYEEFIAPLIKAVKELSDKVKALENK